MPQQDGPRLDGRAGAIWSAYVGGATQESIAAEHGISQQRVSQLLAEVRESIGDGARLDAALLAQERADALLAAVWPAAMAGDPRAVGAALRVLERQAKATGTDAVEPLRVSLERRLDLEGELLADVLATVIDALGLSHDQRMFALTMAQAKLAGEPLPEAPVSAAAVVEEPVDPQAGMEQRLRELTADEPDVDVEALLREVDEEEDRDG